MYIVLVHMGFLPHRSAGVYMFSFTMQVLPLEAVWLNCGVTVTLSG